MLRGIDISKWQGSFNWGGFNLNFVMMRSSLGCPDPGQSISSYTDSQFRRNRAEAQSRGILHGFYHFSYSRLNSPEAEANCFCDIVGQLNEGEIMALDLEGNLADNPVDWALRFLNTCYNRTGVRPLIYMSKSVATSYDWSSVINNNYGLWCAHWGANQDPAKENTPWPFVAMLQYANTSDFGGDSDTFNGTAEQFKKYGYKKPLEPIAIVETPANPPAIVPPATKPIEPTTPTEPEKSAEPIVATIETPATPTPVPKAKKCYEIVGEYIAKMDFGRGGAITSIKKWFKVFFWVTISAAANFGLQKITGLHFHDFIIFGYHIDVTQLNYISTAAINGTGTSLLKWIGTQTAEAKENAGEK